MRARIVGTGMAVPERVLSNRDLERMVDTSDEWIVERTGIRERRIAEEDQALSDFAHRPRIKLGVPVFRARHTSVFRPMQIPKIL